MPILFMVIVVATVTISNVGFLAFQSLTAPVSASTVGDIPVVLPHKSALVHQLPAPLDNPLAHTADPATPAAPTPAATTKKTTTPKSRATDASAAPAPASVTPPAPSASSPAKTTFSPAHFGVVIRPYALKDGGGVDYTKEMMSSEISLAKELGATDVRANAELETATNDDFVNLSIENGLKPTLILETTNPTYLDVDSYNRAYDYAYAIAARYRGKVPYYQMINEASGGAIKPGFPGNKADQYDDAKYDKIKLILRGMGDAIKAADPNAQRIVSANWLGTGIIDRLVADNVGFEIIGWNWYSDMGTDLVKKVDGATLNIPNYLSKYNKKFWVVELNRREGNFDGKDQDQADYINLFVHNAVKHPEIDGLFIFSLVDECGALDKQDGHLGLVGLVKHSDNTCTLDYHKPAFTAFQDLITKYK